jgi:fatty-acid desaturase
MDNEQSIQQLQRKFEEFASNYYSDKIFAYYQNLAIAIALVLGLIVGFLL